METSQLIYIANQLIYFYMRATLALNGLIKGRLAHVCLEKSYSDDDDDDDDAT